MAWDGKEANRYKVHKVISIATELYYMYTGWDLDWNWNNMDKLDRAAS
jgi:hypothetical protein